MKNILFIALMLSILSWDTAAFSDMAGKFGGANALTIYSNYLFNDSMAAELSFGQVIGDSSSSNL